jgi:hypothetical protein
MMNPDEEGAGGTPNKGKVNIAPPPLRLAATTLQGKPGGGGGKDFGDDVTDDDTPEMLAKALEEQRKLLEEFARLQGEISKVIEALTGSTFVKRLKSESRDQGTVSGLIRSELFDRFGKADPTKQAGGAAPAKQPEGAPGDPLAANVVEREKRAGVQVSLIQDDLAAFVDRLDGQDSQKKFKTVLDEMREASPSVAVVDVGNDVVAKLEGDALVDTEFWADKLDYWAELLVGPG